MSGVLGREYLQGRKKRREYIFRYKVRSRIVVYSISKYLRTSKHLRLLDLGAADGLTMLEIDRLLPRQGEFVGIDCSREFIGQAPTLPGNARLKWGDVNRLDEVGASYDVVSALAVLEHLSRPVDAVKNAVYAPKKVGIFVASVPVPQWDRLASSLGLLKADQHECDMNADALRACLEQAGLKVVEQGRFMWAPVAVLPYFGVEVSPSFSLKVDAFARKIWGSNILFVNLYIIGVKSPTTVHRTDVIKASEP